MQDSFMTIIAIFLAGILLFIFPIMAVSERSNDQAQAVVETSINNFVNNAATTGVVTLKNYNLMHDQLKTTGNSYSIDMSIDRIGENIGKKTAWLNGNVVGENSKFTVYTEQILDELQKKGSFPLNRGDNIKVEARNSSKTMAEGLRSLIYSVSGKGNYEIVAESSALVTASGGYR